MSLMEEKVGEYLKKGYTETHAWPGEYLLMIHVQSRDKARVYEDGSVWELGGGSGEYRKVE